MNNKQNVVCTQSGICSATAWINLDDIKLSEVSQSQMDKYYMTPLIWSNQNSQIHRDSKLTGGYQGLAVVSVLWDEKVLEICL